jgi:hypothetical protein
MRKSQIPVARRHDPLAGLDLPLLNLLKWLALLGTLILGSLTIWFFMSAHRGLSVGFLIGAILFGLVWRVATQQLKTSKLTILLDPQNKTRRKISGER